MHVEDRIRDTEEIFSQLCSNALLLQCTYPVFGGIYIGFPCGSGFGKIPSLTENLARWSESCETTLLQGQLT